MAKPARVRHMLYIGYTRNDSSVLLTPHPCQPVTVPEVTRVLGFDKLSQTLARLVVAFCYSSG